MPVLNISVLGSFQVSAGKTVLTNFESNKVRALFAYLVVEMDRPHSRESLAEMFWSEASTQSALANLRYALADLRKVISDDGANPPYLFISRESLQFNASSNHELDIAEFKELIKSNDIEILKQAITLYRGDFLDGFPSVESDSFEEWVVLKREQFKQQAIEVLQAITNHHEGRGEYQQALPFARRQIELEPWLEEAYQQLMRLLALDGQRSAALAQYESCCRMLASELSVEPAQETIELYEAIRDGKLEKVSPLLKREPPAPGAPPFKGLQYFDEADEKLFFGREALVSHLVDQIHSREKIRGAQFMAIIGASGSGKSSLVRAGLIPALKRGGISRSVVITPTEHPLESLSSGLKDINTSRGHTLLFVDQLEELFTLCQNEAERTSFINRLLDCQHEEFTFVVIALRADFYAACAPYENLRQILSQSQEYIGPMSADELRKAIEEPARLNGWMFEPGLIDLLLHDIGADGDRSPEPGALPLLSHALLETWHRRSGRMLTLEGYNESGGINEAITKTAETVFTRLSPEEQIIARNIFLRLTELGEGTQETRRRVQLSELIPPPESASLFGKTTESVLKMLSDARLVITTEATAEVAHEALIREWNRLHEWLTENREGLRLHRHITESAREWESQGRDPELVYRGTRLVQALEWAESHSADLNSQERKFLEASKSLAEKEFAERENQRQRELEAAQKLAESERQRAEGQTRSARQLRQRAYYLAGILLLALVLAVAAFVQRNAANKESRIATSRELAVAATNNLKSDPELSILLSLQAYSTADTLEARSALHQAIGADRLRTTFHAHEKSVYGVVISPDGKKVATASLDGTVKVWSFSNSSLTNPPLLTLSNPIDFDPADEGAGETIAFSPDGERLAVISGEQAIKIWDLGNGQLIHNLKGHSDNVYAVAFSPDGKILASAGNDTTINLWDTVTGQVFQTLTDNTDAVFCVAFSPDGKYLASAGNDKTVRVWSLQGFPAVSSQQVISLPLDDVAQAVAFSPDGKRLAAGVGLGIQVWNLDLGAADLAPKLSLNLTGSGNAVISLSFSADGKQLVSGSGEGNAKVWDATTGQELFLLAGGTGAISSVALNPEGTCLLTANADGTLKLWDLTPEATQEWFSAPGYNGRVSADGQHLLIHVSGLGTPQGEFQLWDLSTTGIRESRHLSLDPEGMVSAVAFRNDLSQVATVGFNAGAPSLVKIWSVKTSQLVTSFPLNGHEGPVFALNFSPDGALIATGSDDGTARIWDVSTGKEMLLLTRHTAPIRSVVFSPDGKWLATGSYDNTTRLWDAKTGKAILTFSGHEGAVITVAFSADGTKLATASNDKTARVWNVQTGKEILVLNWHSSRVFWVAFSRDGRQITTGSNEGTTKIWDIATGQELLTLYGMRSEFTPDGKQLVAYGIDGVTRGFFLDMSDLVKLAESRLTRKLTDEECQKYLHQAACPKAKIPN